MKLLFGRTLASDKFSMCISITEDILFLLEPVNILYLFLNEVKD